jgi:Fe-S cluster assembly protein SufD
MTALTPIRTKAETTLIAQFEALRRELPAGVALRTREAAMASFAAAGLPHRRVEAYHYTDLRNHLREVAPLASAPPPEAGQSVQTGRFMGDLGAHEIVIVNGRLVKTDVTALPKGVAVSAIDETAPVILDGDDPVVALNTALARQTITIKIPSRSTRAGRLRSRSTSPASRMPPRRRRFSSAFVSRSVRAPR